MNLQTRDWESPLLLLAYEAKRLYKLTNTLLVFGIVLALAEQSQDRIQTFHRHFPKPT